MNISYLRLVTDNNSSSESFRSRSRAKRSSGKCQRGGIEPRTTHMEMPSGDIPSNVFSFRDCAKERRPPNNDTMSDTAFILGRHNTHSQGVGQHPEGVSLRSQFVSGYGTIPVMEMDAETERKMRVILARRITQARADEDISQEALAKGIDVAQQNVSKWESATNSSWPTTANIVKLALYFDKPIGWFFGEDSAETQMATDAKDFYIQDLLRKVGHHERQAQEMKREIARLRAELQEKAG